MLKNAYDKAFKQSKVRPSFKTWVRENVNMDWLAAEYPLAESYSNKVGKLLNE